jgi:hypothetical protein
MVLTLYFSKRQIQALSSDRETRVLNDLDEKFHNMAMLAMEDPSIVRVIDTVAYPNKMRDDIGPKSRFLSLGKAG